MDPPFAVPSGQGLAWALPAARLQSGVMPGSDGLIGTSTGYGLGDPAVSNGVLIFKNAKGLFRLATNRRDWSVDVHRVFEISFPFQEYR